jgi:peptidoglycan/LPS O-acetylase OafA/YrhL
MLGELIWGGGGWEDDKYAKRESGGWKDIIYKLFINPIFRYTGKISFSMYLIHFSVLTWLTRLGFIDYVNNSIINYIIRYVLVVCLTTVLSFFSYNLIEKRFQTIGKFIIKKLENNR